MDANRLPAKVLMTADTVGGVWTYCLELIRGLTARGATVALATMGAPLTTDQKQEISELSNVELFESNFRLEWMNDPWEEVEAAGKWLLGIEQQFEPDIVHLNGFSHGALPWSAPKLVVAHSCVYSWWVAVNGCAPPREWSRYREAVAAGLQAADLVVAPSRAMRDCLFEHYGSLDSVAVIPNGRDPIDHAVHVKRPMIFAASRLWDEAKNVSGLAAVANRLPWPVCLAGDNRHPDGRTIAFENTHALGRLNAHEMATWYAYASIYALPARYEPFGLSALEAASARCALVLGDLDSLHEVWGDAAIYVRPGDKDGLAETLLALINDAGLRIEAGERAFARAGYFTRDRMTSEYIAAYERVLRREPEHTAVEARQPMNVRTEGPRIPRRGVPTQLPA